MDVKPESFEYSTRPVTLGEMRLISAVREGDNEALAQLILARTTIPEEAVNALDVDDLLEIIPQISVAMERAWKLMEMGKQL